MSVTILNPASNSSWPFPYAANGTFNTMAFKPDVATAGLQPPPPPPIGWAVHCWLTLTNGNPVVDQDAAIDLIHQTWSTDFSASGLTAGTVYNLTVKLLKTVNGTTTTQGSDSRSNLTAS